MYKFSPSVRRFIQFQPGFTAPYDLSVRLRYTSQLITDIWRAKCIYEMQTSVFGLQIIVFWTSPLLGSESVFERMAKRMKYAQTHRRQLWELLQSRTRPRARKTGRHFRHQITSMFLATKRGFPILHVFHNTNIESAHVAEAPHSL